MENILALIARGTGANPLGNLAEGYTTGRKLSLAQQEQDDLRRYRDESLKVEREKLAQELAQGPEYGTSVFYTTVTGPDGKPTLKAHQLGKGGQVRDLSGLGTPAPPLSYQDYGTYNQGMPTRLGAPAAPPVSNNVGPKAAEQTTATESTKLQFDQPAALGRLNSITAGLDRMSSSAEKLASHPGLPYAVGDILSNPKERGTGLVPEWAGGARQSVADFNAERENLVAQIGFGTLAEMREMSKTGGALGQIAVQELERLENAIVAVKTSQDPKTFAASMKELVKINNEAKQRLQSVYAQTYSNRTSGAPPPPAGGTPARRGSDVNVDTGMPPGTSTPLTLEEKASAAIKRNPAARAQIIDRLISLGGNPDGL